MADRTLRFNFVGRDVSAGKTFDALGSKADTLHGKVGGMAAGIGGVLTKVGAGAAIAGGGLAAFGIKAAAGLEMTKVGFETLLGSGQKATAMIQDLTTFANVTPFELKGVEHSAQLLLGVGESAKNVIPDLTAWGNATSALGGTADDFNHVMLAVSQSMAAGRINAGDMNQIVSTGIPVWSEMAKATGKTVPELRKLSTQGKLLSADILPKLQAQMQKDYGGAMTAQSKTLAGQWSTLKDTVVNGMAVAFQPLLPLFERAMPSAINVAGGAVKGLAGVFKVAVDGIATAARVVGPAVTDFVNGFKFDAKNLSAFSLAGTRARYLFTTALTDLKSVASAITTGAKSAAQPLIDGVRSGVQTGNWAPMGAALAGALVKAVEGAGAAVGKIGDVLGRLLGKVDWVGIGIAMGKQAPSLLIGLAAGIVNFDFAGLLRGLASHWQEILLAVVSAALLPAKFVGAIAKALDKIPIFGTLLRWGFEAFVKFSKRIGGFAEDAFRSMGSGFMRGLGRALPDVSGAMSRAFNRFRSGVTSFGETLYLGALEAMSRLGLGLGRGIARISGATVAAGRRLFTGMWGGMSSVFSLILRWAGEVGGWIFRGVGSLVKTLTRPGRDVITGLWNAAKAVFAQLFRWSMTLDGAIFRGVGNLSRTLWRTGENVMTGLWGGAKAVFVKVTGWLGGLGGALANAAKRSLGGLFSFINNSIIGNLEKVTSHFGMTNLPRLPERFAAGGITHGVRPGYTPGRDTHLIAVGGGEAIMRPEWTRAVGPRYVQRMNQAARSGGVGAVRQHLADGGEAFQLGGIFKKVRHVVGDIGDVAGSALKGVGGALGTAASTVAGWLSKGAEFALGHVIGPLINRLASQFGDKPLVPVGLTGGVMRMFGGAVKQWGKDQDSAQAASGGGVFGGNGNAAKAIAWAKAHLGIPYLWGGTGPRYDCSGFTQAAWRAGGLGLPRRSQEQFNATQRISRSALIPGDLAFSTNGGPNGIHHVMLYGGGGKVLEAARTGTSTRIAPLRGDYFGHLAGNTATSGGGGAGGTPSANEMLGRRMATARGWGMYGDDLDRLWTRESGWRTNADNPTSSAYGIPQALPGSKMASAGADWRTNPATQIKWGLGYIAGRYGNPAEAWAHSQRTGWYDNGGVLKPGLTMAYNGTGHDETVVPATPAHLNRPAGGTTINLVVNVNTPLGTPQQVATTVLGAIEQHVKNGGRSSVLAFK